MDWTDHTTRRSFEAAARNYNFYGGLIWIFFTNLSRKIRPWGGLDLFLVFRVHSREGDIDDLEQERPTEIVLVFRSLIL